MLDIKIHQFIDYNITKIIKIFYLKKESSFYIYYCDEYELDMEVNKEKEISLNIPTVSFNIPTHISLKAISFIISYHVSS